MHDYQDACMQKVIRFIQGELNKTSMLTTVPTTKVYTVSIDHRQINTRMIADGEWTSRCIDQKADVVELGQMEYRHNHTKAEFFGKTVQASRAAHSNL